MQGGERHGRVDDGGAGAPGGGPPQEAQEEALIGLLPRLFMLPR